MNPQEKILPKTPNFTPPQQEDQPIRKKGVIRKAPLSPKMVQAQIPSLSRQTRLMHGPPPSQHVYKQPGQPKPLLVYSPMTIKQVVPSPAQRTSSHSPIHEQPSASLTVASRGSFHQSFEALQKRTVTKVVAPSQITTEGGQASIRAEESDSALDPSHFGSSPAELVPSYQNNTSVASPLATPTITIVETGSYKKKQTTPRRIDIPMMRVQAQQHRSKFLHKPGHSVNQSPSILSVVKQTAGPLIKVISGPQKKSAGGTAMTEEEEQELRTYEAGLQDKDGSEIGLVTNTSGTMRNGSPAHGTPALVGRAISRSARPSPKSKHFTARHSSSVDQPRTVAEVSESGATVSKAAKVDGRRVSGEVLQRSDTPSEKRNVVFSTTKRSIDLRSKRGTDLPKHKSEGSPAFKLSAPAVLDALKKYHQGLSSSSRPRGTLSSTRNEVISVPSPKERLAAPAPSESATPSPSPLKAAKLQPKHEGGKVEDITEKSELTPSPQPQPPTPRSVAKETLAGTSINTQDKGFSYKNSLTENSVLTTNTNFTPTRWLPKGIDRQTLQQHAFLEDLLALHIPQDEKGGRYKGVTPSQLIGPERTASLPRGSITGAPIISQTEKQRTRYKKVKQRRNVLRDEQFLHREGDFYKDIFLDEYYKRRHLARREEFFSMLQNRLLPDEERPQSNKKEERRQPLPSVASGEQNRFALYSREKAYHTRQQGSLLSPSKIADSFESVLLASSVNREELQPPPVFNRFRNVLSGGTVKKEEMSLKFNQKLLDMRARFKRGEVRVGTSPVAQNMYYDQMGLQFSRQLLSREALSNARRLKPKSAAFSFDASVASPLGTADSDAREHFVPKKEEVKGAGLGIEIGYTGIEPRSKDFYLDMLSDTTTPLILPDIPEQQRQSNTRGVSAPFRSTGFRRIEIISPRSGDGQVRVT